MPISDSLQYGVQLMLIGMGTVFVFLGLLVLSVFLVSRLTRTLEGTRPKRQSTTSPAQVEQDALEQELVAVISAAIHRFRQQS